MSRTHKDAQRGKGSSKQRRISVRAVRRDPPDLRKLSQALIQLAMAQAADEAAAQQSTTDGTSPTESADD